MHIRLPYFIFTLAIITSLFSCNSNPDLSKEYIQGTWECYDYEIEDTSLSPQQQNQVRSTVLSTAYVFEDSVLHIKNEYIHVACACTYDFEKSTIAYTQINNSYIQPSSFIILEHTPNTMVLEETVSGSRSRMHLQRVEEK
ncbi:MAG: hypothetical protein R6U95_03210 [Bacteroidales bacterium]